ncbi:MAG: formate dehydrogenase accessory sulfurtransferase FdhD [Polaribacter sp.]|nr:formate dehydrogenase accessory sulfurtransferase FdhD [Polaribacter sp.]MDG1811253.1 formate dehydrogenase accessory sulfurtransferase FdhD [Polaribacter sp.]MDG1993826.1 formate dehydrogenase accessory sulfurtransferase FdhD [Polaribacter sp.]
MSEFNLTNKLFFNYDGILVVNEKQAKVSDGIVVEAALQININNKSYTVVMRTPGNDFELIRGLLYAEDIYKVKENLSFEIIEEKRNGFSIINCNIPKEKLGKGYLNKRTLLSVSSCGICGKQDLNDIELKGKALKTNESFSSNKIKEMSLEMTELQKVFKETGGSHAAAIFDKNYHLISLREDIGRHNAVDKVIGDVINQQKLNNSYCMLVSGRVSYEIVSKAFFAKIGIIVAVSACSSLAIDYAKEFGICLIGFSRTNKMTIYANPKKINELK